MKKQKKQIEDNIKYDFDDILIEPSISTEINSRYLDVILPETLPIFTAPMDTVVDLSNVENFINADINVVLPRTIPIDVFYQQQHLSKNNIFISLGINEIITHIEHQAMYIESDAKILIDVANGHMSNIVEYCKKIKKLKPSICIMVGNIANPETYQYYAENQCVDFIRVGIGAGNACITTKQSAIGFPMASLISETYEVKQRLREKYGDDYKLPKIVADGGMKDYSDIVKALALGADFVMIGSLFNKSLESCAPNYFKGFKVSNRVAKFLFKRGFKVKKYFRGMSTKEAQKAMGKTNFKTSEGVIRYRNVEYHLDGWVENFKHYLRNAMSYTNAKTLDQFIGKVNIIRITNKAYDRYNK